MSKKTSLAKVFFLLVGAVFVSLILFYIFLTLYYDFQVNQRSHRLKKETDSAVSFFSSNMLNLLAETAVIPQGSFSEFGQKYLIRIYSTDLQVDDFRKLLVAQEINFIEEKYTENPLITLDSTVNAVISPIVSVETTYSSKVPPYTQYSLSKSIDSVHISLRYIEKVEGGWRFGNDIIDTNIVIVIGLQKCRNSLGLTFGGEYCAYKNTILPEVIRYQRLN